MDGPHLLSECQAPKRHIHLLQEILLINYVVLLPLHFGVEIFGTFLVAGLLRLVHLDKPFGAIINLARAHRAELVMQVQQLVVAGILPSTAHLSLEFELIQDVLLDLLKNCLGL